MNPLGRKTEGFCQGDEVRVPEFTTDFAPPNVGLLIARDIAAFAEKGYSTSSIKYIADLLGMRGAALYYYLPSKEAALAAVCEAGVTTFIANLSKAIEKSQTSSEQVRAAIHVQLSPLRERPYADYIRVFVRHRHELPDEERRRIVGLSREYQKLVNLIFAEGVASGEFRANLNVEFAAFALIGLCNSVISSHVWPKSADIEKIRIRRDHRRRSRQVLTSERRLTRRLFGNEPTCSVSNDRFAPQVAIPSRVLRRILRCDLPPAATIFSSQIWNCIPDSAAFRSRDVGRGHFTIR